MPNRIIKESICVSEQIDELTAFEENFFYRLLVNCDDYGCMDAREKVLAAKLYPLKRMREKDILNALSSLARIGLICLYEVENHPYLKVIKWADHQRVRVSKHKYPEPTDEQIAAGCGDSRQVAASCGKMRLESNPIQSNPNPNPNPNPTPPNGGEGRAKRFTPPTKEEIFDYCLEEGFGLDVDKLYDHYTSNGWRVGNQPMKDWKAAVRNWERRDKEKRTETKKTAVAAHDYHQRDYSNEQETAFMRMMEEDV